MNNIIKRVWNQNRMVNIEDLRGMAFQAEDGGHTFEISGINDAGESVELSGTVAGIFMRPDNADIALTGTASDGVVSVTLTEDCYAVTGRFLLTVFVTDENDQKVAVYAATGTVTRASGGAVAGDTPQDVVDLINAINAAVASIPADYTDLMAAIAPTYSNTALYAVGAYSWYDGVLYRCTTAITTAEAWTEAHWTQVALGSDVCEIKNNTDKLGFGTVQFSVKANTSHSSTKDQIVINIPQGSYYKITNVMSASPSAIYTYEIDANGNVYQQHNLSHNSVGYFKAHLNVVKLGFYIGSQSSAYTASFIAEVIGSVYSLPSKNKENINGLYKNAYAEQSVTWSKKIITATGTQDDGNGATSDIIRNAKALMLSNGCRAVVGAYSDNTFIGKLNSSGGFDQASGNWGYITGFVDIEELTKNINANGIIISILPTNGVNIVAETVQAFGDDNCVFYVENNDIKKEQYLNWFEPGSINSNGTNSTSDTRVRSDFIDLKGSNKIHITLQSDKWCSYSFYGSIEIASFILQASSWVQESATIDVPNNARYVRIVVRKSDNSNMTVDDVTLDSVSLTLQLPTQKAENRDYFPDIVPQENTIIRSINHRGYNADAPENTLPAYALSRKHGFKYVETDVAFTSDGVAVCLHDETINRTARNADGTAISSTIYIKNITYAEALTYDFGIWKGAKYAGTKIPTYKEWLLLCKKLSLHPVTEIKNGDFSSAQAEQLADIVKSVGMEKDVSFISFMPTALTYMRNYFPDAWMALAPTGTYSTATLETLISNINAIKAIGNAPVVASVNYDSMTSAYYEQLSDVGIGSLVWTVDNSWKLTNIDDTVMAVLSDTIRAGTTIYEYVSKLY